MEALASALAGDADLAGDARFADEASRRVHDSDLAQVLGAVFVTSPAQYWEDYLLSRDVGCVVAHAEPPEAVLQSKEFAGAADLLVQVEHPSFGEHVRSSRTSNCPAARPWPSLACWPGSIPIHLGGARQ